MSADPHDRPTLSVRSALDYSTPSTRGNSLLTDICLWFLREDDPWLPTAAFIVLFLELGVPETTTRTVLHRMTKAGYLERSARDTTPGYAMSADWRDYMAGTTARDKAASAQEARDTWVLLTSRIPDSRGSERHAFRTLLTRSGFKPFGNGVWIAPSSRGNVAAIKQLLISSGFDELVDLFEATYNGFDEPASFARKLWNLEEIQTAYRDFVLSTTERLDARGTSPDRAFAELTTTSNTWRTLERLDPGLPPSVLPQPWPREHARSLLNEIIATRLIPAREHVKDIRLAKLRTSGHDIPE